MALALVAAMVLPAAAASDGGLTQTARAELRLPASTVVPEAPDVCFEVAEQPVCEPIPTAPGTPMASIALELAYQLGSATSLPPLQVISGKPVTCIDDETKQTYTGTGVEVASAAGAYKPGSTATLAVYVNGVKVEELSRTYPAGAEQRIPAPLRGTFCIDRTLQSLPTAG